MDASQISLQEVKRLAASLCSTDVVLKRRVLQVHATCRARFAVFCDGYSTVMLGDVSLYDHYSSSI